MTKRNEKFPHYLTDEDLARRCDSHRTSLLQCERAARDAQEGANHHKQQMGILQQEIDRRREMRRGGPPANVQGT